MKDDKLTQIIIDSTARFRKLRQSIGMSQEEFSKKVGVSQRKVSRLETTQAIDRATARLIGHIFDIEERWLLDGSGEEPDWSRLDRSVITKTIKRLASEIDSDTFSDRVVDIPIFDAIPNMGAGNIVETEGYVTGQFPLPNQLYQQHFRRYQKEKLGTFKAEGDSMTPTIASGDYVLVHFDPSFRGDGIYLVQLYESLLVKRLQRTVENTILLISDNPSYREQVVTESDEGAFRILGRTLWVSHMLGY